MRRSGFENNGMEIVTPTDNSRKRMIMEASCNVSNSDGYYTRGDPKITGI
jgi:hypothetical protein